MTCTGNAYNIRNEYRLPVYYSQIYPADMIAHFQRAARMSVVERAMLVSSRITMFVKQSILRLSKVGSRVDTIKFFVHTAEVL